MKLICILLLLVYINHCNGFSLSKLDDKVPDKRHKRDYYQFNDIILATDDDGSEYIFSDPAGTFQYPKKVNSYDIKLPENNDWKLNTNSASENNDLDLEDLILLQYEPESSDDQFDKTFICIGSPKCPTITNTQKGYDEDVKDTSKDSNSKKDTTVATTFGESKVPPYSKKPKDINISIKFDHKDTINNKEDVKHVINGSNHIPVDDKRDEIQNPNIWNIIYYLLDLINKTNVVKQQTTPTNVDTQSDSKKPSFYQNLQGLFTNIIKDNIIINNAESFSNPPILSSKDKLSESNTAKNTYKPIPEVVWNKHETTTDNPKTTDIDINKTTVKYEDRNSVESGNYIETTNEPEKVSVEVIHNKDQAIVILPIESTTNNPSYNEPEIVSSTKEPFSKDKPKVEKEKDIRAFLGSLARKYLASLILQATNIIKKPTDLPVEIVPTKDNLSISPTVSSNSELSQEVDDSNRTTNLESDEIENSTNKNEIVKEKDIRDFLGNLARKYLASLILQATNIIKKPTDLPVEIVPTKDNLSTSPTVSSNSELSQEVDDSNRTTNLESDEIENSTNKNEIEKEKEETASNPPASDNILDHVLNFLNNDEFWDFMLTTIDLANKYLESWISRSNYIKKESVEVNKDEDITTIQSTTIESSQEDNFNEIPDHNTDATENSTEEPFSKDKIKDEKEQENFWDFLGSLANKYLESLISHSHKFIKDEIKQQFNKYLDTFKDKFGLNDEDKDKNDLQKSDISNLNSNASDENERIDTIEKPSNKDNNKNDKDEETSEAENDSNNVSQTTVEKRTNANDKAVHVPEAKDIYEKEKSAITSTNKHNENDKAIQTPKVEDKNDKDCALETSAEKQNRAKDTDVDASEVKNKDENNNVAETPTHKNYDIIKTTTPTTKSQTKNENNKDNISEVSAEKEDSTKDTNVNSSELNKNEEDNIAETTPYKNFDEKDNSKEISTDNNNKGKYDAMSTSKAKDKNGKGNTAETSTDSNDIEKDESVINTSKSKDIDEKDDTAKTSTNENDNKKKDKPLDESKTKDKSKNDNEYITRDKNSNEQENTIEDEVKDKNEEDKIAETTTYKNFDEKVNSKEISTDNNNKGKNDPISTSKAKDKNVKGNTAETSTDSNDIEKDESVINTSKSKDINEKDDTAKTSINENDNKKKDKPLDESKTKDKSKNDNESIARDENSNEQDKITKDNTSEENTKSDTTNLFQSQDNKEKDKPKAQIKGENKKNNDANSFKSKDNNEVNSEDSTKTEKLDNFDNKIEYITGNPTTKVTRS